MKLDKIKPRMTPKEIIAFRNKHNLSVKELAGLLGVTFQAVLLWEAGSRNIPETTVRLLKFFDSEPDAMERF